MTSSIVEEYASFLHRLLYSSGLVGLVSSSISSTSPELACASSLALLILLVSSPLGFLLMCNFTGTNQNDG